MSIESSIDFSVETIQCPACENEEAKIITHMLDIPYYDDFLMVNISCSECGFKSSDFFNTNEKGYRRFEYQVNSVRDDSTKVVKAKSGIIRLPDLGIVIEPLNDSTTWIRNIEGILIDIEKKLLILLASEDDRAIIKETKKRISKLNQMKRYEIPFTIIVEDTTGNSLILPANEGQLIEFNDAPNDQGEP